MAAAVIGLVTGALAFMLVVAPAASAVPQDPNATPVPQDCEGSTEPSMGAAARKCGAAASGR
jgi:hypothetical protein